MSWMKPMSSMRSASSRHEDLDATEVNGPLADMVEETSRGGDDDLRPGAKRTDLRVEADAAVDRGRANRAMGAVRADALLHLEGELARRSSSTQDADGRSSCGARAVEALKDREDEGGRLAGARLGAREHVATGEDERNRLGLNWGGLEIALVRDRAEELGREPE